MRSKHGVRVALLEFSVLAVVACRGDGAEDLLRVPVSGASVMDVSALNRQLDLVKLDGVDALAGPVEIAARLARGRTASWHSITARRAVVKDEYEVTIVLDGVGDDDSVAGYRYTLLMSRQQPGSWSISSAKQSWRCWPGRGHRELREQFTELSELLEKQHGARRTARCCQPLPATDTAI